MIVTRCPSCQASFRVTPEQLRMRQGKVRCGKCRTAFNALDALVYRADVQADTAGQGVSDETAETVAAQSSLAGVEGPGGRVEPTIAATPDATGAAEAAGQAEDADDQPAETEEAQTAAFEVIDADEGFLATEPLPPPAPRRGQKMLWSALALLAFAALGAQAVYVFRSELARDHPQWRPQLESWCAHLGCKVALPHVADLMAIEASELHPDPSNKKLLVLQTTLKNRAPYTQAYPDLELTLTDTSDQPLARRVFAPRDYLGKGADPHAGFGANADLAVKLWIDASSLPASGYRVYIFYP